MRHPDAKRLEKRDFNIGDQARSYKLNMMTAGHVTFGATTLKSGQRSMTWQAVFLSALSLSALSLLGLVVTPCSANQTKKFLDIKMTPEVAEEAKTSAAIRPDAAEVADLLRIRPYVDKLVEAKQNGGLDPARSSKQIVQAKMFCMWRISTAMMEVRQLTAKIDKDLAYSNIDIDTLVAKQNRLINTLNTINFMQGGTLGTIKQSVNLHGEHQRAQYVGIPAFGISTALAMCNLLLPTLYGHNIETPPNILSHFFSETYRAPDADQSFLWTFMRAPIPGSQDHMTRREILLHHWHDFCGLKIDHKQLLSRVSALPQGEEKLNESTSVLAQRIALLHDLKSHIEEFDGSLYELHRTISSD